MITRILPLAVLTCLAACGDKADGLRATETSDVAAAAVADVDAAIAETRAADGAASTDPAK